MSDDPYRDFLEQSKDHARRRVRDQARALIRRLESIEKAAESGFDPIISELGELQNTATMFDAQCATYATTRQLLKDYDGFKRDAEIGH